MASPYPWGGAGLYVGESMKAVCALLAGTALSLAPAAFAQDSAPVAPATWTVQDFATLPMMEAPALSPNGLHIASRAALKGAQNLVIADVHEGPNRVRAIALGEIDLNWWTWVNDDWLIAGVGSETFVQGMPWYISRVIGVKRDGSKINVLAKNVAAQGADDVIWTARDGTPRILLSYQTSIYYDYPGFWPKVDEVDVSTGKMRAVLAPRQHVRNWYADASGTVRMGVGYNDAQRTGKLLYRPDGKAAFRVVDRADRRRDESLVVPLLFTADPKKAIASDDRDGTDALYELDLDTLELGKKLFSAPGFDLGGISEDATGTSLAGVRYVADAPAVHWFDANLAKIQADIDKAVGDRRARIVSTSRDGQKLIVHVGTADQPGAYYYYDTSAGAMSVLSRVSDRFPGKTRLSPVRTIRYKARDGL